MEEEGGIGSEGQEDVMSRRLTILFGILSCDGNCTCTVCTISKIHV